MQTHQKHILPSISPPRHCISIPSQIVIGNGDVFLPLSPPLLSLPLLVIYVCQCRPPPLHPVQFVEECSVCQTASERARSRGVIPIAFREAVTDVTANEGLQWSPIPRDLELRIQS